MMPSSTTVQEYTSARWRIILIGWTARSLHPEDPSSGREVEHKIEIGFDSLADVPAVCKKLIAKVRKIQR
jgi:hypothetical protein